jgi:hypothetical protein
LKILEKEVLYKCFTTTMSTSGTMKKVSGVMTIGEGGKDLEQLREDLAEQLRNANTGGVTKWLDLDERLDFLVLHDISNYRKLLRRALSAELAQNDEGEADPKKETAQKLLKALDAYEEGLKNRTKEGDAA